MKSFVLIFTLILFAPIALRFPIVGIAAYIWIDLAAPQAVFPGGLSEFRLGLTYVLATAGGIVFYERGLKSSLKWTGFGLLFLFFLLALSTLEAMAPIPALEKFNRMSKALLIAFTIVLVVDSKERLDVVLWTIFLSICCSGILGAVKTLLTGGGGETVVGPLGTHIEDRNYFGIALLISVGIGTYLAKNGGVLPRGRWLAPAVWGLVGLNFIAVIGTQSRGAFLGIVAMFMVALFFSGRRLKVMGIALVVFIGLAIFAPDVWVERMLALNDTSSLDTSAQSRLDRWKLGLRIAASHPWLGGGPAVFQLDNNTYLGRWLESHNTYIELIAELGVPALLTYLAMSFGALISSFSIVRRERKLLKQQAQGSVADVSKVGYWEGQAARGLSLSLIAVIVCGFFVHMAAHLMTYLPMACIAALRAIDRTNQKEITKAVVPEHLRRWMAAMGKA